MPRRLLLLLSVLLVGCGGGGDAKPRVTVSAASSLKTAFTAYEPDARFSFAGSDELAAQIQQGVKPDVYAAANTKLPDALAAKGLLEEPVVFAVNRLVLAVPDGSPIDGLGDLPADDVQLAIGAEGVPVGDYTRKVLDRLPAEQRNAILARVRSNEPDVAGVVGKLVQGAADAGFVYVTDVQATDGALRAIELPGDLQPRVEYGVAVVKGAKHPKAAQAFVDGLLSGAGRDALRKAGFEPPPGQ